MTDERGNVLAPIECYAVNISDIVLLQCSLQNLTKVTRSVGIDLTGSICNGDMGFDSKKNRKAIWNRGMLPNIPENTRRRDTAKPKRGRPRHFSKKSYDKRFAVERTFGWEDKYRSLVTRYDRKQANYRGRKTLVYTLINLRYFCGKWK
ncbi:MAG: transposase [Patescibacteria group bacterium]